VINGTWRAPHAKPQRHATPSGPYMSFTFVNAVFTFVNRRSRCQPTRFARELSHDTSSLRILKRAYARLQTWRRRKRM
jgi:hypothetical protein